MSHAVTQEVDSKREGLRFPTTKEGSFSELSTKSRFNVVAGSSRTKSLTQC